MTLSQATDRLAERISSYTDVLGATGYIEGLKTIREHGTGADLQRVIFKETNDFKQVIGIIHKGFWK